LSRAQHSVIVADEMVTAREQFIALVRANVPLCREHYRLVLRVDDFPATEPGQFIQISCRDVDGERYQSDREIDWSPRLAAPRADVHAPELLAPVALLRRPFSLAGRRDVRPRGVELDVIHRVVGVGTDWMSRLNVGDRVDILGPLGNRFTLPPADGLAILVGGGVGIPPMLYLAGAMKGRRAIAFSGATSRDLLPLTITEESSDPAEPHPRIAEFAAHGIPSIVTTDDGTYGVRGYVTDALERWLDASFGNRQSAIGNAIIYTCGPEPMMKRVAAIAAARGIECQVAVERAMACGMGTCQSCCIRVRKPDPTKPPLAGSDWCWRLACTDGPVFRGADLLW
jgi:dihydroorotate dehydrogenase electron transfer subunit